jgi:hypothetical protein
VIQESARRDTLIAAILQFLPVEDLLTQQEIRAALEQEIDAAGPTPWCAAPPAIAASSWTTGVRYTGAKPDAPWRRRLRERARGLGRTRGPVAGGNRIRRGRAPPNQTLSVLLDTGIVYAYYDRDDRWHARAPSSSASNAD